MKKLNPKIKKVIILLLIPIVLLGTYLTMIVAWSHTYVNPGHTCRNMSIEVHDTLAFLGIPSQLVYGHRNNSDTGKLDKHCWVRVFGFDLEATNLCFINDLNSYHVDGIFNNATVLNMTNEGLLYPPGIHGFIKDYIVTGD
jgi:hypothetical protein